MKTRSRIHITIFTGLLVASGGLGVSAVLADTEENPYISLTARNAFNLREPKVELPPQKPVEEPVVEDVDVFLTGVAESNGEKRAYFMYPDTNNPGKFKYFNTTLDGGDGPISKVTSIDLEAGKVEVMVNSRSVALNLEDNAYKGRASVRNSITAANARTLNVTNPASVQQINRTTLRNQQASAAGARIIGRGGATNFEPVSSPSPEPAAGISTGDFDSTAQSSTDRLRTIPTRTVRSAPTTLPLNEVEQTMSAEERAAAALIQKQMMEDQGIPMPPLPFGID